MSLIAIDRQRKLDAHCRTYVIGNGKKTGYEYLTGYCCYTGKILGRTTDKSQNSVSIPTKFAKILREKRSRCVLHHNHPGGSSLSREDLLNISRLPGTMFKYAHGHARQWYRAENLRSKHLDDCLIECDITFLRCLISTHGMQARVPAMLRNHIFNLGLDRAKVVRYTYKLDAVTERLYDAVPGADVNALVEAVCVGASNFRRT